MTAATRESAAATAATAACVPSREPSSTTMHSQAANVWRRRLRSAAGSVAPASRAGSRTDTLGGEPATTEL